MAAVTLDTPAIEPTDRSIPPVRITNVMPTDIIPVMETCFKIVITVLTDKKFED